MRQSTSTISVDLSECPDVPGRCQCGPRCIVCGFNKHFAVHGPVFREKPGTPAYDHQYRTAEMKQAAEEVLARVKPLRGRRIE
jgi:hypothetical protein